ncbi:hypothetical protein I316_04033 [Kwoniella heveanensis BCC8398]|uniref:Beta-lactamase-related domain-containing protein n=1 Tax=Kwoniella heveanensis BCC8398 TaxID=1296120 RepID=A0A1B9GST5_9TREE|nr:hypothetical protein I316_04033 [Kwoniella heveanensis BCC8398]
MEQSTPSLTPETHQWLNSLRERYDVPGLSVVIVTSPEFVSADNIRETVLNRSQRTGGKEESQWKSEIFTSGIADLEDHPLTSRSLFSIASNTKLFTALSLGLLIDRKTEIPSIWSGITSADGKVLEWDTQMKDILPGWGMADRAAGEEATLKDLLTMRTGVPFHGQAPSYSEFDKALSSLRDLPLSAPFRSEWQYNNAHYDLLGHVVSRLSGKALDQFVKDEILDPLGMSSAAYDSLEARSTGRLTTAFIRSGRVPQHQVPRDETKLEDEQLSEGELTIVRRRLERKSIGWWTKGRGEASWGGSGLIMDSVDVARWLRELLSPSVLPKHILAECSTPHIPSHHLVFREMSDTYYGYGQWSSNYRGYKVISHYGYNLGQQTVFVRIPEKGIAIGALNTDDEIGQSINEIVVYRALDELLGLAPKKQDWEREILGAWKKEQESDSGALLNEDRDHHNLKAENREEGPDLVVRDSVVGQFHHPAWGVMELCAFEPETNAQHSHLIQLLLSSVSDIIQPYSIAIMPGREDWYLLLSPTRDRDTQKSQNEVRYTTIQIHDHHSSTGVVKDGIARLLHWGDAWVDERGFGLFDNFWGTYGASSKTRSLYRRSVDKVQKQRQQGAKVGAPAAPAPAVTETRGGMNDPKDSAEVWFDRIHP